MEKQIFSVRPPSGLDKFEMWHFFHIKIEAPLGRYYSVSCLSFPFWPSFPLFISCHVVMVTLYLSNPRAKLSIIFSFIYIHIIYIYMAKLKKKNQHSNSFSVNEKALWVLISFEILSLSCLKGNCTSWKLTVNKTPYCKTLRCKLAMFQ